MLSSQVKADLMEAIPSLLAITEGVGSSEAPVEGVSVTTRAGGPAPSLHFPPRPDTIVVDDDFAPVVPGSGAAGRIAVRGRMPIGYHNDPEKTARTFVEVDGQRWVLPGDMATVDADGTIRLLGRGSMCINTGGEKVYPEEVEAALKAHPAVADALVVGRPARAVRRAGRRHRAAWPRRGDRARHSRSCRTTAAVAWPATSCPGAVRGRPRGRTVTVRQARLRVGPPDDNRGGGGRLTSAGGAGCQLHVRRLRPPDRAPR